MGTVHITLGVVLIILMIVVTAMDMARPSGAPRGLRGATIGLLDLQILLGIISWIVVKPSSAFVWHPLFMVVAVVIAHVYTNSKRPRRTRTMGWIAADALLVLGAVQFGHV